VRRFRQIRRWRLVETLVPPDRYVKPGDTIEIHSPAVGSLHARVVERKLSE
jgi:hypothetical protein